MSDRLNGTLREKEDAAPELEYCTYVRVLANDQDAELVDVPFTPTRWWLINVSCRATMKEDQR